MRYIDIIFVFLIFSLIAFMLFVVFYLKDEKTTCLKDPIGYFEQKNEGASCTCIKDGIIYPNTIKYGEKENEGIQFEGNLFGDK